LWATALGYAEALKKRGVAYRNLYLPTRLAFYTRPAQLTRKRWSPEGHATMMFATLWQVPDGRVSTRSLSKAILLTRAPVEATIYAEYSVILADGDVTLAKSQSVLVLAAGKVTLNGPDDGHVVVIARGEITVRSDRVSRSVTLVSPAGVKTESGKPLPLNAVPTEDSRPVLRGLWSTPDHLGLEVKVADGGLAVTAVKSRSIAAKAGVRVGDVIERAGGEPVKASDELMRYYWRGAAAEECPLRLRRGKEAVEVKVRVDRPGR
jgi:hypothetical protein